MPRTAIELDPSGYRYCSEPGFYYSLSGSDFAGKIVANAPAGQPYNPHAFFAPPGLEWLLPLPRQFNPEFYRDARLDQHVVVKDRWTFASGVTASEFELTKKADGTSFPKNKFVHITRIPAATASLDSTNYTNLGTAAGITLPPGMVTVATASTTPGDVSLTTPGHLFTPMLQWSGMPRPDDVLVFGWSNFAMVLAGGAVVLCRNPSLDRTTWQFLARWAGATAHGGYRHEQPWYADYGSYGTLEDLQDIKLRMFKSMLVGFKHLCFFFSQGGPQLQQVSEVNGPNQPFPAAHWWWGACPGQHFYFQAQVMGYESASTTFAVDQGKPLILWDLGATYKPSVPYYRAVSALVHSALTPTDDLATDDTAGILTYSSAYTGNTLAFSVTDENGNVLAADGTHSKGGFSLTLIPGTPGGGTGGYLAPQFERASLKFPTVQLARQNDPVTLTDDAFEGWRGEASYRDPKGKSGEIYLKKTGAALYYAHGFHRRGSFPVHVLEDQDADDIPETVVFRGWVKSGKLTKLLIRNDSGSDAIRENVLQVGGLLDRIDHKPHYLPQLVDPPSGNRIKHTYAAEEVFKQAGFDTALDSFVHVATDPRAGTGWEYLPEDQPAANQKTGHSWKPGWDETWLGYLERIAVNLVGWTIFETLTDVWYCPDMSDVLVNGGLYFRSATLYRKQSNAVAAGVSPRQAYREGAEVEQQEPLANRIRAIPSEHEHDLTPWKLDSDLLSITEPSAENYVGEPVTEDITLEPNPNDEAVTRSCRVRLNQLSRRLFLPSVELARLAPWQVAGAGFVDVGYVARFEALDLTPEDCLLVHVEVEQKTSRSVASGKPSHYETRLVGEKVPLDAAAAGLGGAFPGVGSG